MTVARILAVKGRDVVTTQPHRTLEEVSRLLAERQIGAVVVTGADGDVPARPRGRSPPRSAGRRVAPHDRAGHDDDS